MKNGTNSVGAAANGGTTAGVDPSLPPLQENQHPNHVLFKKVTCYPYPLPKLWHRPLLISEIAAAQEFLLPIQISSNYQNQHFLMLYTGCQNGFEKILNLPL